MLTGFAAMILAVYLFCALLVRLSIYALPLFVAVLAATTTYDAGNGIVASLAAAAVAAVALLAAARFAFAIVKSDLLRAAIGTAFAVPAAFAGYYAIHGLAAAAMPPGAWQSLVSLLGAIVIAAASWLQWSRVSR